MSKIINHEYLAEARSVMKDKFPTMIEYFLEDSATYINSIKDGLAANDAAQIAAPAHTIKSSAGQLGAEKISEIANVFSIRISKTNTLLLMASI